MRKNNFGAPKMQNNYGANIALHCKNRLIRIIYLYKEGHHTVQDDLDSDKNLNLAI